MILSKVDLPAPLTPTRATLSRSPISNVTPSRAWWPPYAFLISCTRSIVVAPGGFRPGMQQARGQDGGPARPARQTPGARQHRLRASGRTFEGCGRGLLGAGPALNGASQSGTAQGPVSRPRSLPGGTRPRRAANDG